MADCWTLTLTCSRIEAEAIDFDAPALALLDPWPTIVVREIADDRPEEWLLEAIFEGKPDQHAIDTVCALLPKGPEREMDLAAIADQDWVTLSQSGLAPIAAGPFHIHTSHDAPSDAPGVRNFRIDASRAFGTGHHDTTHGCVLALSAMKQRGLHFRRIADIGTGTGLLAFAAHHLWPTARVIASDIDPVAVDVAIRYAHDNGVKTGPGPGRVRLIAASGTDHPVIRRGAPYDLLVANILAGPLIELAPAFGAIVAPGGTLLLAGLIRAQTGAVIAAYRKAGFLHLETTGAGEWPTLRLRKRPQGRLPATRRISGRTSQKPGDTGEW